MECGNPLTYLVYFNSNLTNPITNTNMLQNDKVNFIIFFKKSWKTNIGLVESRERTRNPLDFPFIIKQNSFLLEYFPSITNLYREFSIKLTCLWRNDSNLSVVDTWFFWASLDSFIVFPIVALDFLLWLYLSLWLWWSQASYSRVGGWQVSQIRTCMAACMIQAVV